MIRAVPHIIHIARDQIYIGVVRCGDRVVGEGKDSRRLLLALQLRKSCKRFHVRMADSGNTAWLIFPDREVALTKQASATRYSNGVAVLEINGAEATLKDGAATFNGCKSAGK